MQVVSENEDLDVKKVVDVCPLCGGPLTKSDEHIIPSSIGGRRVVTGFICKSCNDRTGAEWDYPLFAALHHFCVEFGIKRQAGKNLLRPVEYQLSSGETVRKFPDGHYELTVIRHGPEKYTDADGRQRVKLRLTGPEADLWKEAKEIEKSFRRKEQKGLIKDLSILRDFKPASIAFNEDLEVRSSLGGDDTTSRSIVKSAVAYAFDRGILPDACEIAINFLRAEEGAAPCYYPLVAPKPFHCFHGVALRSNASSCQVEAIVSYFGAFHFRVLLSKQYKGPPIDAMYIVDPVAGRDLVW